MKRNGLSLAAACLLLPLAVAACARAAGATSVVPMPALSGTGFSTTITGLAPCTDGADHEFRLKSRQPVYVLVHGCFGSTGQFHGLARVLAFHGLQTVCFTYNDRDRLTRSALQLRHALDQLITVTQAPQLTVIGHSQGALIAHKALTYASEGAIARSADLRLVTISGPFSGIAAAKTCGRQWLYPLTLGLLPLTCYAVTGAKWTDITASSAFIRDPGELIPQVSEFLKIDTDERSSCRQQQGSRCLKKDAVFSLAEQRSATLEADGRAKRVQVRSGHVEIVGDESVSPIKLIAILQQQGAIPPTAPDRLAGFQALLSEIYGRDELQAQSGEHLP